MARPGQLHVSGGQILFQSTRHLRGATMTISFSPGINKDFNPRATYVARRRAGPFWLSGATFQSTRHLRGATSSHYATTAPDHISIHAPLTWRDRGYLLALRELDISIHAPLTWRDFCTMVRVIYLRHFNPRATYVARLRTNPPGSEPKRFQSTRHLRGAT